MKACFNVCELQSVKLKLFGCIHSDQLSVAHRKTRKQGSLSAIQSSHWVLYEQVKSLPLLGSVLFLFFLTASSLSCRDVCACFTSRTRCKPESGFDTDEKWQDKSRLKCRGPSLLSTGGKCMLLCQEKKRRRKKQHEHRIAVEGCEDGRLPECTGACEKWSLGIF